MTGRIIIPSLLLTVFALTAGCQSTAIPTAPQTPAPISTVMPTATPAPTPTPDPIQAQIDAMTDEEKVGQLLTVGFAGTAPGEDVTVYLQDYQVGGLILFGRNVESAEQLLALTNELKARNGDNLPLFLSVDQEGGLVDRMPPEVHRMPRAYDIADDFESLKGFGTALGTACADFGFNVDFAPSLDIWSNPDNTVIGTRSFGREEEQVTYRGGICTFSMMATGTIPVVKHFPGHGDTAEDSHVGLPAVDKSLDALRQSELVPFQEVIQGGPHLSGTDLPRAPAPAVMVAHILMTQLDPDLPASLSPAVVTDLLRGEMGFDGVVYTDDLTMAAITEHYGLGEAAVLAIEAGCDELLVCHGQDNIELARSALLEAVASGRIPPARLDESLRRILTLKAAYRVSSDPVPPPDLDALNTQIDAIGTD